jgi:hypothetical protein
MIQFHGVSGNSTAPPNQELATHATSAIDIFVIVGDFRGDPTGLSGARTIPQGDHQQHRDETGADPQGDIHDGLA